MYTLKCDAVAAAAKLLDNSKLLSVASYPRLRNLFD